MVLVVGTILFISAISYDNSRDSFCYWRFYNYQFWQEFMKHTICEPFTTPSGADNNGLSGYSPTMIIIDECTTADALAFHNDTVTRIEKVPLMIGDWIMYEIYGCSIHVSDIRRSIKEKQIYKRPPKKLEYKSNHKTPIFRNCRLHDSRSGMKGKTILNRIGKG